MDKYYVFRKLMDLVEDFAEVTDADMSTWNGGMKVVGEDEGQIITIEVSIDKKEVQGNAEELE